MLHCTCRFLKLYIHGIHLSHWCDVIQIILGFHCETSLGAGARHCISDIWNGNCTDIATPSNNTSPPICVIVGPGWSLISYLHQRKSQLKTPSDTAPADRMDWNDLNYVTQYQLQHLMEHPGCRMLGLDALAQSYKFGTNWRWFSGDNHNGQ